MITVTKDDIGKRVRTVEPLSNVSLDVCPIGSTGIIDWIDPLMGWFTVLFDHDGEKWFIEPHMIELVEPWIESEKPVIATALINRRRKLDLSTAL